MLQGSRDKKKVLGATRPPSPPERRAGATPPGEASPRVGCAGGGGGFSLKLDLTFYCLCDVLIWRRQKSRKVRLARRRGAPPAPPPPPASRRTRAGDLRVAPRGLLGVPL